MDISGWVAISFRVLSVVQRLRCVQGAGRAWRVAMEKTVLGCGNRDVADSADTSPFGKLSCNAVVERFMMNWKVLNGDAGTGKKCVINCCKM